MTLHALRPIQLGRSARQAALFDLDRALLTQVEMRQQ